MPSDRTNPAGDVKLYGRAEDIGDPELRRAFREAIRARIDWAPAEPDFHLFSLDVDRAAFVRFSEETWETRRWSTTNGLRKEIRPND